MTKSLTIARKIMFVGTNNPRGDEPFWPHPHGSTGHRLWQLVEEATGWDADEFLMRTHRVNIVDTTSWSLERAKARVADVLAYCIGENQIVVGRAIVVGKVAATLLGAPVVPCTWDRGLAMIPHTSGLNRWYNTADNRRHVVQFLAEALS